MKVYKSIVDENIFKSFSDIRGRSLMNHVANSYSIEMAIGFGSLFCPEIVEEDDCIFIAEFYNGMDGLKEQFNNNRKDIEMFVNSWSLTHLLKDFDELDYTINYIDEFAKAIQYFWQMRFNMLFPERSIVVEIGDEIMGEEGVCITVYQK